MSERQGEPYRSVRKVYTAQIKTKIAKRLELALHKTGYSNG